MGGGIQREEGHEDGRIVNALKPALPSGVYFRDFQQNSDWIEILETVSIKPIIRQFCEMIKTTLSAGVSAPCRLNSSWYKCQISTFVFLRNTNVPNGKRNVAYGNSKNQGPSALGTKPFSIRNKNAHTQHSVFQNSRNFGTKPN